jgi:hypothetical protein
VLGTRDGDGYLAAEGGDPDLIEIVETEVR